MATSESDSGNSLSDDDMEKNGYDYDMYDDDYDGFCDYDDIAHLTSLRDSILGSTAPQLCDVPSIDIPSNYSIHLAMNSKPELSKNLNTPPPYVNDSLRMYLIAPPLVRRTVDTKKPCLSIDPTIDEFQSKNLSTPELYVGNIPYATKYFELKQWFIDLGHGVSRVDLKTNKVRIVHDFILLLKLLKAKISFREVLVLPSFGLILLPLRKMFYI
jgi:hypothetical protein